MARPRDPARRTQILDAAIAHLGASGLANLSLRPLAEALGQSTRVLTHHFADKDALLRALLERLDEVQHAQLRATPGWGDPSVPVGDIVHASWHRHLEPANLPGTRLIHEIQGLAAAGRLATPRFLRDRAEFVAGSLALRGVPDPIPRATFLNATYSGLQADHLATGDRARVEAALADLCALANSWSPATPEP